MFNYKISDNKTDIYYTEIIELTAKVGWGENYFLTEEIWLNTLAASTHIAYAKIGAGVIGFARILADAQMCMFYDVCVDPAFQKNNVGSALMNHLIDKVKDKNYVSIGLFVWEGNKTAIEFYRKLGFEVSTAMELKPHMRKFESA